LNKQIKLIIFDSGDILYDASKWRKVLYKYLKKNYQIKLNYKETFYIWDNYYLKFVYLDFISYEQAFIGFLSFFSIKLSKEEIKHLKKIKSEVEKSAKPFSWVKKTLGSLKNRGVKVAILSDSEAKCSEIEHRYKEWGILECIDKVFSSKDMKTIKPYREAYMNVLKYYKLSVKDTIFIGHDEDELIGAKNLGISTIDYNDKKNFKIFLERNVK